VLLFMTLAILGPLAGRWAHAQEQKRLNLVAFPG
jgi:hypothetical protein